jgi:uncharacterized membrane protein HdeD (DUF308 family)
MLSDVNARAWWALVLRGLLAIAFGVLTIMVPSAAVGGFVLIFAIYALVDGIFSLAGLTGTRLKQGRGWLNVLGALLSIAAGIIALVWPGITALALFLVIAIWAIALGILELVFAVTYGSEIEGDWAIVLSGILWIAFGVILFVWPAAGILAVLAMIASFAIIRGVMLIVAGLRMRSAYKRITTDLGARGV